MQYEHVKYYLKQHTPDHPRVLEIGCGAAEYRSIFPKGAYTGTDVPNEHYQSAGDVDAFCNAASLPFADEVFDLIFCQAAIDYMEHIHDVFLETRRVLKPNGKLLIFTYNKQTLERIHSEAQESSHPAHQHFHVYSEKEFIGWLTKAGYSVHMPPSDVPLPAAWWKRLILSTPPMPAIRNSKTIWRTFVAQKEESHDA